jgi:hypothetical protein
LPASNAVADHREVKELSIIDAAYIAGLIDGKGTVSLLLKEMLSFRRSS